MNFSIGDIVKVVANRSDLEEICAEEALNRHGVVCDTSDKGTNVNFGDNTLSFYNDMLEKVSFNDDIVDYPDTDTYSDEYLDAMNEAYGEIE